MRNFASASLSLEIEVPEIICTTRHSMDPLVENAIAHCKIPLSQF
jgi:hypothetical protein